MSFPLSLQLYRLSINYVRITQPIGLTQTFIFFRVQCVLKFCTMNLWCKFSYYISRMLENYAIFPTYMLEVSLNQDMTLIQSAIWNSQVRIARIFNTYGPRMCIDDGRVVSNFVAQVCHTSNRSSVRQLFLNLQASCCVRIHDRPSASNRSQSMVMVIRLEVSSTFPIWYTLLLPSKALHLTAFLQWLRCTCIVTVDNIKWGSQSAAILSNRCRVFPVFRRIDAEILLGISCRLPRSHLCIVFFFCSLMFLSWLTIRDDWVDRTTGSIWHLGK